MEEANQIAAQCWCDPETENKEMDVTLAGAVARRIAFWMETAAQNERNSDYYRGLLVECGEAIGHEAFVQDDGGISEDVLCAKVPELVRGLTRTHKAPEGLRKEVNCVANTVIMFSKPGISRVLRDALNWAERAEKGGERDTPRLLVADVLTAWDDLPNDEGAKPDTLKMTLEKWEPIVEHSLQLVNQIQST